ncbi:MAG TPA: hypothetical protein VFJ43_06750, partial [Bacteroidia bacterium]|nr:hypothetical protein [Bacteroidia bacterium]
MKSSLHTDHLSPKELADLLNGKLDANANKRVKRLLNDCELSKEALAGFTAVPSAIADLPDLKNQIAKSAGIVKTPVWLSVLTIAVGASLLAGMTYVLWPREPQTSPLAQAPVTLPQNIQPTTNSAISVPPVDLTPKAEHFVNPEAKPKAQPVISQGTVQDTSAKINNGNHETIPVFPEEKVEVKPVVPEHPEVGYNGSVGFIMDLKITEFEKYYRKTIEVHELNLTGIPAQFEDERKRTEDGNESETVRNVPAEQFLNEGLRAFHDGKYGKCIEKMEVLKKNNDKDLNATFYMGVSYVKLEMFEKAIAMFDEVLSSPNNVFHEEAKWYKALA